MRRLTVSRVVNLCLITALFAGCTPAEIAAPEATSSLQVREARAPSTTYSVVELGTLPGDVESTAWEVNNAGYVVMYSVFFSSTQPRSARWYMSVNGQKSMLGTGVINGLSNGPVTQAVGVGTSNDASVPALWTFSPSTGFSAPSTLDYSDGYGGVAQAVNDIGDATGSISSTSGPGAGAIWKADGTRILFANVNPAVYEGLTGRDINNNGDVAVQLHDNSGQHRAYLRTSDGSMIELSPLPGHVSSLARGISEVSGGKVYVAGTSDDRQGNYRAVRWTVDLNSHSVVAQSLADRSLSYAMADDGTIAGDLSTNGGSTGFVWKHNSLITLKSPKGTSSTSTTSISGNGRYVSGGAKYGSYWKAVYWVAP